MELDVEDPPDLVDTAASTGSEAEPMSREDEAATQMADLSMSKVPLTIITGYLGSGKTTLVNHILQAEHGKKIAVILNEFGDSTTIEKRAINVRAEDSTLGVDFLELGNGCICCSVKDTGVAAIEALLARHSSAAGVKPFDYIVLETSGLADPGGIIPLFWLDDALGSSLYLDGVVCVVDAGNLARNLDQPAAPELASAQRDASHQGDNPCDGEGGAHHETVAHLQLSTADTILLNKVDTLPSSSNLNDVEARIRSINALAPIHCTSFSQVPKLDGVLLNLHAYDNVTLPSANSQGKHTHLDPTISTISLLLPPLSHEGFKKLEQWLRSVLWENTLPDPQNQVHYNDANQGTEWFEVHRTKGLLSTTHGGTRMIQGVREVFEIVELDPRRNDDSDGEGKIIFIGRDLHAEEWERSLHSALGI